MKFNKGCPNAPIDFTITEKAYKCFHIKDMDVDPVDPTVKRS